MNVSARSLGLGAIIAACAATLAQAQEKGTPPLFESLAESGFAVRKAISGPAKPAVFGYHRVDGESFYTAEFAVLYFSPRPIAEGKNYYLGLQFTVEGNLTTAADARSNNFIRVGPALNYFYTIQSTPIVGGLYSRLGPVYESTKDGKIQNVFAEYEIAPVYFPLAIGRYKPILPDVLFHWSPVLTAQIGRNVRREVTTFETEETIVRVIPQIYAGLAFPTFAKQVGLHAVTLTASNKTYLLPFESGHQVNNLFESSLELAFTKEFSFNLGYKKGREAPKFNETTEFTALFGLKFGSGGPLTPGL